MLPRRIQALLPVPRCVFCDTRCTSVATCICDPCLQDLPWRTTLTSTDCDPMSVLIAPLDYAFPIDAALKLLKFQRRCEYLPAFAQLLCHLANELPHDVDALLPMPLHWRRQAMRGFNQATELARPLHRCTGLPLLRGIERARHTPYQSGLDAAARKRNLSAAFVAKKPVAARHVLIVDDVITTGESCRQLAKTVLQAGAQSVSALALARS